MVRQELWRVLNVIFRGVGQRATLEEAQVCNGYDTGDGDTRCPT